MVRSLGSLSALIVLLLAASCGSSEGDSTCTEGAPSCPCYGNGTCDQGLDCVDGYCVEVGAETTPGSTGEGDASIAAPDGACVPSCTGKQCGPDGCGGRCGFCIEGIHCIDGLCLTEVPDGWGEDTIDHDTSYPDTIPPVDTISDPCQADNYCNNSYVCGGGTPLDWSGNVDPDCPSCFCNFYPGSCEAKADESDEVCPCDYDCMGAMVACDDDAFCDTWCPMVNNWSIDPDCPQCPCDYYGHICETGEKCSTAPCQCDPDCQQGVFLTCAADGHCDSWCPTDEDYDCLGDPKNGKYCQ